MATRKHATKQDLKDARTALKTLRSQGIVRKDFNLSKVIISPITGKIHGPMSGGRTTAELIREFDDVLSNKAAAVPASKVAKENRKLYQTKVLKNPKTGKRTEYLLVSKYANEKLEVTEDGKIKRTNVDAGIRTLEIPVEYHNLEQYLNDLSTQKVKLDKGFKRFGFRYRGGYSNTFPNLRMAIEEILTGESTPMINVFGASPWEQRDEYMAFELVEIMDTAEWRKQQEQAKIDRAKARRAEAKKSHHKKPRRKK